eukprot:m.187093 g.187093  ORF g.187093 m.187093 type:complete len:150 (+) comp53574_c0_seq3:790-1239(+)
MWGLSLSFIVHLAGCDCDESFSICDPLCMCDPMSGQCNCELGITGQTCDTCVEANYFANETLRGCQPCDCHLWTSSSTQCNTTTGQCACTEASHAGGLRCDECLPTFYHFSLFGCHACDCNTNNTVDHLDVCDTQGQCNCTAGEGNKCT